MATIDYRKFRSGTKSVIRDLVLNRKENFLKNMNFLYSTRSWGYAMAKLVEAPRYKSEGSEFNSRSCYVNFSLT